MTFIRQALEICPVGSDRRDQDRPVPALARDRRRQHRAPAACGPVAADDPGVVAAAQPRHRSTTTRNSTRSPTSRPSSSSSAEKVLSRENDRVRDQVIAEIRSAAEHLTLAVRLRAVGAQRSRTPATGSPTDLERRKQEAQDALQQTALWQQVLNDGIADLTADVDHDLRDRFRAITQHTEQVIDYVRPDPALGRDRRRAGERGRHRRRRQLRVGLSARRGAGPGGGPHVRRGRPGRGQDARRSSARDMGAGFGELKSLARLEAKPIKAGPQGRSPACAAPTAAC